MDAGLSGPDGADGADGAIEDAASVSPVEAGTTEADSTPFDPGAVVTCDTATITDVLRPSCAEESLRVAVPDRVATVLDLCTRGVGEDGPCGR